MPAIANSRRRAGATKSASVTRLQARLLGALARRPIESLAAAIFAALMTGILLNALALQNARHPSPLFGTPITVAPQLEAPQPIRRPASVGAAPAVTAPSTPAVLIPMHPVAVPHDAEPQAAPAAADPIGQILRNAPQAAKRSKNSSPNAAGRHTAELTRQMRREISARSGLSVE